MNKPEVYHCWDCGAKLENIHKETDGTVLGTCWHCVKDDVSAIENDEEE